MAAIRATMIHAPIGVPARWFTREIAPENGSWRSRDMPWPRRIVDAWIDRQQRKIATDTTSRYATDNAFDRLASMIAAGEIPRALIPELIEPGVARSMA